MKRYRIQKTEYERILKYEQGDFFAMKCLIEVNEKLGDKPQAKKYKSKLTTLVFNTYEQYLKNKHKIEINYKALDKVNNYYK